MWRGAAAPWPRLATPATGVRGKPQVTYGLTCSPEGRPVAICVHEGSTQDQQTLPAAVALVRERFGIEDVVVVGDRGMLTQAHAAALTEAGVGFVSALKSAQIRKLVAAGDLQLSLFDETNLAEISSAEFPGERLSSAATRPSRPSGPANATSCCRQPRPNWRRSKRWSRAPADRCATPTPARSGNASDGSATATRSPNTSSSRSQTAPSRTRAKPSRSKRRPRSTAST